MQHTKVINLSDYDNMNYDTLPEHVRRDIVRDYVGALHLIALLTKRCGGRADFNALESERVAGKRIVLHQPQGEKGGLGGDLQVFVI